MREILKDIAGMTIMRVPFFMATLFVFTIIIPDWVAGGPRTVDVQLTEMASCGVLSVLLNRFIVSPKEDNNE